MNKKSSQLSGPKSIFFSEWQLKIIGANVTNIFKDSDSYIDYQILFLKNIETNNLVQVSNILNDVDVIKLLHPITLTEGLNIARLTNKPLIVGLYFQNPIIERIISKEDTGDIEKILIWVAEKGYLSILKLIVQNQNLIRDTEESVFKFSFAIALENQFYDIVEFYLIKPELLFKITSDIETCLRSYIENLFKKTASDMADNLASLLRHRIVAEFIPQDLKSKLVQLGIKNGNLYTLVKNIGIDKINEEVEKIFFEAIYKKTETKMINFTNLVQYISPQSRRKILILSMRKKRFFLTLWLAKSFYTKRAKDN